MKWTLGKKLGLVFGVLIVFFSLTLGISAYFMATRFMRQNIQTTNQTTVRNVQDYYLQNQLNELSRTIKYWSVDSGLMDEDHSSTLGTISQSVLLSEWKSYRALNSSISMIYFASTESDSLLRVPQNTVFKEDFDPQSRSWYIGALDDPDQVYWSRPYMDAAENGDWILTVSKAVLNGDKVVGVVGIDLRLQAWSALLEGVYANQAGYLVVMGPLGEVYAHPNINMLAGNVTGQKWANEALINKKGNGFVQENGRHLVYSYVTLGETNWKLIGIQEVNFSALFSNLKLMTIYTIFMVVIVMLLGGYLAARYIMKPLYQMMTTMQAVASGDMEARSAVTSKDEIGAISLEFDGMLDRLFHMNEERDENLNLVMQQNREISEQRQEIHALYEMTDSINQELEDSLAKITATYLVTVRSLANAIEANDPYTRGHCERVSRLALLLGGKAGFTESEMRNLEFASILHDVGKIGVPTHVLKKPGRLTAEEFEQIKRHPLIGAEILSGVSFLGTCRAILLQHHERVDGCGYPFGLTDGEIMRESKILSIVDSFDAMTSDRPYRLAALSVEAAVAELQRGSGTQFDTGLTNLFASLVINTDFRDIMKGHQIFEACQAG